jgi:hypothetical protein
VIMGAIVLALPVCALGGIAALLSFRAGRYWALLLLLESVPVLCLVLLLLVPPFRARLNTLRNSIGPRKQRPGSWSDLSFTDKTVGPAVLPVIIFGVLPVVLILAGLFRWDKELMSQRVALVILAWNTYSLCLAYSFADHHKFGISITLSLLLAIIAIHVTVAGLGTKNGMLKLFDYPGDPLAPGPILAYALSFAGAFGCLHFNISLLNSSAYNGLHDWQDSLYFSVITLATVGYGDITPLSHVARWTCMVEIVMGFVILVIALNATMSFWLQRTKSLKIEAVAAPTEERSDLPVPAPLRDFSHLE